MSEILLCTHCGERTKSKYCKDCSSKKQRDEIDAENKRIKANLEKKYGSK